MSNLRQLLIDALQDGEFLKGIYEIKIKDEHIDKELCDVLLELCSDGTVDLAGEFEKMENSTKVDYDFWILRHLFEQLLPHLEARPSKVMDCVVHLISEAGDNGAATFVANPFKEYCEGNSTRCSECLQIFAESTIKYVDLFPSIIAAGFKFEPTQYLEKVGEYSKHNIIQVRSSATFALGNIEYSKSSKELRSALGILKEVCDAETEDQIIGSVVRSILKLLNYGSEHESQIVEVLKLAFSKGDHISKYYASNYFAFTDDKLSKKIRLLLFGFLEKVKPTDKGTIHNIDRGIVRLLKAKKTNVSIQFLENLISNSNNKLNKDDFIHFSSELHKNKLLLSKIIKKWFLSANPYLCLFIQEILSNVGRADSVISIDKRVLMGLDIVQLEFIARKAVGYFFMNPITASSIIVSLMPICRGDGERIKIGRYLLDPLLVSYSGKLKDYLDDVHKKSKGVLNSFLKQILKHHKKFLADINSMGIIYELHPSIRNREIYSRNYQNQLSAAMKAAEKKSVFSQIIKKSIILYGNSSVHLTYSNTGETTRKSIQLESHEYSYELPRYEVVDSVGLDYMLRVFRVEDFKE